MEKRFMTTKEVAGFLCISEKTLRNYGTEHGIYRPCRPGIWHVEHVTILEKVWAGVLSEEEGLAFWVLAQDRMRESIRRQFGDTEGAGNEKSNAG